MARFWRAVPAALTLREQVDRRWPNRDRRSDGIIADANHDPESFHQPDADGWVHALDLDEDLGEPGAMRRLADQLAACARDGRDGGRILHLVYEDQVASATAGDWAWRGSGYGHRHHLHITFTDAAERDASPFPLPIFTPKPPPPITREDPDMILLRNASTAQVGLLSGALFTVLTDDRSTDKLTAAGVKLVDLPAVDWNRLNQEGA